MEPTELEAKLAHLDKEHAEMRAAIAAALKALDAPDVKIICPDEGSKGTVIASLDGLRTFIA